MIDTVTAHTPPSQSGKNGGCFSYYPRKSSSPPTDSVLLSGTFRLHPVLERLTFESIDALVRLDEDLAFAKALQGILTNSSPSSGRASTRAQL